MILPGLSGAFGENDTRRTKYNVHGPFRNVYDYIRAYDPVFIYVRSNLYPGRFHISLVYSVSASVTETFECNILGSNRYESQQIQPSSAAEAVLNTFGFPGYHRTDQLNRM